MRLDHISSIIVESLLFGKKEEKTKQHMSVAVIMNSGLRLLTVEAN